MAAIDHLDDGRSPWLKRLPLGPERALEAAPRVAAARGSDATTEGCGRDDAVAPKSSSGIQFRATTVVYRSWRGARGLREAARAGTRSPMV